MGANNGCAKTKNKVPMSTMYETYPNSENKELIKYLESIGYADAKDIIDDVMLYAGGLRGGKTYAECLKKGQESCKWAFDHDLHWNRPISYKAVPCPQGLTNLTGLVPADPSAELMAAEHFG